MNEDKNYQEKLIDIIEDLPEKEIRKSKLDLLQRIIERTDEFQENCDICRNNHEVLENIVRKVHYNDQSYLNDLKKLKGHMLGVHKLVDEGHYMAIFLSVGIAIGAGLGVASDNMPIMISAGLCLGSAVGVSLDVKAKKDKKVL
ncbi:MAG: hypothetical protein JXQ23_09960 [Clostridia bacterium]|nr:hypothetical protein [Clostridia bacterium]